MNSDSYFRIGTTHDVCEDYAISGEGPEGAYAVMSDGCSGSPMTDFGSRFMALATARLLQEDAKTDAELDVLPQTSLKIASMMAGAAGLPQDSLDATLGYVYEDGNCVFAFLSGDGAIAAKKRNGEIWISIIEYPSNAPPYLSYSLHGERAELFLAQTDGCPCIVMTYRSTDDGFTLDGITKFSGMKPHEYMFNNEEYELVMVMSDGVSTFQKPVENGATKHYENVDPIEIVKELMDIKSTRGEFIKRRCKRVIKNLCLKEGWRHLDDFSVAAIHCNEG